VTALQETPLSTAAVLLIAAAAGGCGGGDDAAASGDRRLRASVVDAESGAAILGALVSIERGGIYLENSNTARGNPHYVIGGRADDQGAFDVPVPDAVLGLHVFANDYLYAPRLIDRGGNLAISIAQEPRDALLGKPTVTDLRADPASVAPGGQVRLSALVKAASADDPLSDETLAVEPTRHWTAALDPPSAGVQGVGYPDGSYTLDLKAPEAPGRYTFFVVTTSEGCVTSDAASVGIEVR
jgi:hypothetical protein